MGNLKSKIKTVDLPDSVLDQLRCSLCKQYLSCAPIKILSDGKTICGRCSLANLQLGDNRELKFEIALSHVRFPCSNKDYGCEKKLLFDHSVNHETKCVYHPFICPSLPYTNCNWKGSVVQVQDHFYGSHSGMLHYRANFQIDISVDKESVFIVVMNNATFFVKYKYESSSSILYFDVKYFSKYVFNENFKIKLASLPSMENNINLKGDKCLPYFYNSPNGTSYSLTLSKFLAVLSNPTLIDVEIVLPSIPHFMKPQNKSFAIVNYNFLDSMRCIECQNYLSLPIFDGPHGTVCLDCNNNYSPSNNEELYRNIMDANYPCRWNKCKTICKGHSIRVHESVCQFQPYTCPAPGCSIPLIAADRCFMICHLDWLHFIEYFSEKIVYVLSSVRKDKLMVTVVKNNEVVCVKHQLTKQLTHIFKLNSLKSGVSAVIANIQFKHGHCKLRSQQFCIGNNQELTIKRELLPKCFRDDEKVLVIIEVLSSG